ncbi:MAG: hypothetical protein HY555_05590 [Euryarchaeota archaeon]|nr:hypothetical protein [Euryarchaeota archaeon]
MPVEVLAQIGPNLSNLLLFLTETAETLGVDLNLLILALVAASMLALYVFYAAITPVAKRRRKKGLKKGETQVAAELLEEGEIEFEEREEKERPLALELPSERVQIESKGDRLVIKLSEPRVRTVEIQPPEAAVERQVEGAVRVKGPRKAAVEPLVPEEGPAEIREPLELHGMPLDSAMAMVAKRHSLESLTMVNTEGLLIGTTSEFPEEEAAQATSLLASLSRKEELRWIEIAGKEMIYLFYATVGEMGVIAMAKRGEKLDTRTLLALGKDIASVAQLLAP